ncbi:MAG: hypothetical protein DRJ41_03065 [Thermoprotei archaeon]|nr:MAG: hypothetical protein DRJ41_03065 [Thermoprotei archaeon]
MCRYTDRYFDLKENEYKKFRCPLPSLKEEGKKDSDFCAVHDPEYWKEHEEDVIEKLKQLKQVTIQEQGKILFIGCNIPGTRIKEVLGREVEEPAYFTESIFYGETDLSEVIFKQPVAFFFVGFEGKANFSKAKFEQITDFRMSIFEREAVFRETTFNQSTYFLEAEFKGDTDFSKTVFREKTDFSEVTFAGLANFSHATFKQGAYFSDVKFEGDVNFRETVFNEVSFWMATFEQKADFSNVRFRGITDFVEVWFKEEVKFITTMFEKTVSFDFSKIHNAEFRDSMFYTRVNFSRVMFSGSARFINVRFLNESIFSSFEPYTEFTGSMFYRDAIFFPAIFKRGANFFKCVFRGGALFHRIGQEMEEEAFINMRSVYFYEPERVAFIESDLRRISLIDTDLSHVRFMNPKLDEKFEIYDQRYMKLKEPSDIFKVANIYRFIRRSLEESKRYYEAGWLWRREMDLLAEYSCMTKKRGECLAFKLYKYISSYGESIDGALRSIVVLIFLITPLLGLLSEVIRVVFLSLKITINIAGFIEHFIRGYWSWVWRGVLDTVVFVEEPTILDIIIRVISLIMLANLYMALRRKLERK